jgi:hypothetical protein
MVFFDSRGLICIHIISTGVLINGVYMKALGAFVEHFKKEWPMMSQHQKLFHCENASMQTASRKKELGRGHQEYCCWEESHHLPRVVPVE